MTAIYHIFIVNSRNAFFCSSRICSLFLNLFHWHFYSFNKGELTAIALKGEMKGAALKSQTLKPIARPRKLSSKNFFLHKKKSPLTKWPTFAWYYATQDACAWIFELISWCALKLSSVALDQFSSKQTRRTKYALWMKSVKRVL